jgi:hypothetical protein
VSAEGEDEKKAREIPRPLTQPPASPDRLAREEEREGAFMAALSPEKRNIHIYERELRTLRHHCDLVIQERAEIHQEHRENVQALIILERRHTALLQAYRDSRAINGLATLLLALGATSVSIAGAISDPTWKPPCLWAGIGCFACGFLFAGQSLLRNPPHDY